MPDRRQLLRLAEMNRNCQPLLTLLRVLISTEDGRQPRSTSLWGCPSKGRTMTMMTTAMSCQLAGAKQQPAAVAVAATGAMLDPAASLRPAARAGKMQRKCVWICQMTSDDLVGIHCMVAKGARSVWDWAGTCSMVDAQSHGARMWLVMYRRICATA